MTSASSLPQSLSEDRPYLLAIDTSHKQGSVAIGNALDESSPIEEVLFSPGLVHGQELQARIIELLEQAKVDKKQIGLICVSAGPGSFTGIRIGVAGCKAMAWALGCCCLKISTLEAVAQNYGQEGEFAVVLDARRHALYGARFKASSVAGKISIERQSPDQLHKPQPFFNSLPESCTISGEGRNTLKDAEGHPQGHADWDLPKATSVYQLGLKQWKQIQSGASPAPLEYSHPHSLVPTYLRASQAEEMAQEKRQAQALLDQNNNNEQAGKT